MALFVSLCSGGHRWWSGVPPCRSGRSNFIFFFSSLYLSAHAYFSAEGMCVQCVFKWERRGGKSFWVHCMHPGAVVLISILKVLGLTPSGCSSTSSKSFLGLSSVLCMRLESWWGVGFIYHTSIFLGSGLALSPSFCGGNIVTVRIVRIVSRAYHRVHDFAERCVAFVHEF